MSSTKSDQYLRFAVGKSGGSNGQPCDIKRSRRGLVQKQDEPLVLWWVKLLKAEYSADQIGSLRQSSYRRSRWGHSAEKRVSPISPFFAMHRDGRLFTSLLMAFGLIASLNMVALADDAHGLSPAVGDGIPSAERFSMIIDFAGKHNQYLDLSKLSEFKWSDEIHVASRRSSQKPPFNRFSVMQESRGPAQPQVVREKMSRSSKNDRELTDPVSAPEKSTESGSSSGASAAQIDDTMSN